MQNLQVIEFKEQRVLTTKQLAEAYGSTKRKISYNFNYNKKRYVLGKHYISVSGADLKALKASLEIQGDLATAPVLYLWTEKGALLHAKSLNTDKAWEVYDWLVDFYFRVREKGSAVMAPTVPAKAPTKEQCVDNPDNKELQKKILELRDFDSALIVITQMFNRYISMQKALSYQAVIEDIGVEIMIKAHEIRKMQIKLTDKNIL